MTQGSAEKKHRIATSFFVCIQFRFLAFHCLPEDRPEMEHPSRIWSSKLAPTHEKKPLPISDLDAKTQHEQQLALWASHSSSLACPSDMMDAPEVPFWCAMVHRSHRANIVGGMVFCNSCGATSSGLRHGRLSQQCVPGLEGHAPRAARELRKGVLPSYLRRWPDGNAGRQTKREVHQLTHSEALGWYVSAIN